jgi:ketosteroid isomerase-like protein
MDWRNAATRLRAHAPIAGACVIVGVAMMAGSCGREAAAPPPDPMPIVETERAFAVAGTDSGIQRAFAAFIAPDGIMFRGTPMPGSEWLKTAPTRVGPPFLEWWPVYAGIAKSGDLGFTTGPWAFGDTLAHGFYFTIWKKQPDGTWRFQLDHGPPHEGVSKFRRDAEVTFLAPSSGDMKAIDGETARARVRAHETAMAAEMATDARAAYRKWVTPDALMLGSPVPPTLDPEGQAGEILRRPERMTLSVIGDGASAAGDIVYTYGDARWQREDGTDTRGHYVRLWQFRGDDWRIVFEEVIEVRQG